MYEFYLNLDNIFENGKCYRSRAHVVDHKDLRKSKSCHKLIHTHDAQLERISVFHEDYRREKSSKSR